MTVAAVLHQKLFGFCPDFPDNVPIILQSIISDCCKVNPRDRPSLGEVLEALESLQTGNRNQSRSRHPDSKGKRLDKKILYTSSKTRVAAFGVKSILKSILITLKLIFYTILYFYKFSVCVSKWLINSKFVSYVGSQILGANYRRFAFQILKILRKFGCSCFRMICWFSACFKSFLRVCGTKYFNFKHHFKKVEKTPKEIEPVKLLHRF
ncbi:hypothetical protein GEMRC1_010639 [Eukaryota sp. GEM-RC1]